MTKVNFRLSLNDLSANNLRIKLNHKFLFIHQQKKEQSIENDANQEHLSSLGTKY